MVGCRLRWTQCPILPAGRSILTSHQRWSNPLVKVIFLLYPSTVTGLEMNDLTEVLCIIQKYPTAHLLRLSAHWLLQLFPKPQEALRRLHFQQTLAGSWFSRSDGLPNKLGPWCPEPKREAAGTRVITQTFPRVPRTFRIPLGTAAFPRFWMLTNIPEIHTDWCNISSLAHDSRPRMWC